MGQEIVDFLRFVVHPRPGPRLGGRHAGSCMRADLSLNAPWWRLAHWAVLLWMVNIFVFAPLALSAADAGGAQHRLDMLASGLGLGLYIAAQIAVAHNGTLSVTSTEQSGTCFIARLPATQP